MRSVLIVAASVVALAAAAPAGACAAADDPCLDDPLVAKVTGETWWEHDLDGSRGANERSRMGAASVWADYNRDGVRQRGEAMVETAADGSYLLPVDTRRLNGVDRVDVRFAYASMSDTRIADFAPRCVAPAAGCVRNVEVNAGQRTTGVHFPTVAGATLRGTIWDDKNDNGRREAGEGGVPHLGVYFDDNRNGRRDAGEYASHRTAAHGDGTYQIPIPTRYQAAGGELPPIVLDRTAGVDCTAPRDCAVTGLRSRTGAVVDVEHGVARPVVIFIHGYGGSQISCPGKLLWFQPLGGPDLLNMRLGADGRGLKTWEGGTVCSQNSYVDGLVMSVAGADIYGGASEHFEDLAWPGRHHDYVWDWRNSPEAAVAGLDALIERARCGGEMVCSEKIVRRVQLVGHSMGGLVMRHYIDDPARADKVQRAVTVGTPYWGSPKPIFPLAAGIETPIFSGMDLFMDDDDLKAAARTMPGHFALMPAFGYGKWLSVEEIDGGRPLDIDGVKDYLRRIGVDPLLHTRALSEHGRVLDHFKTNGVDYQVIVGGGVPTMGGILLRHGLYDRAVVSWTDGDGTVPAFAAAHDTPRENLHYVCGVKHVPLTTVPATTQLMDGFLIRGEEMRLASRTCDWEAVEVTYHDVDLGGALASAARSPRVIAGGRTLSLEAAEQAGLVEVLAYGGASTIVAGAGVQVELPARGTASVRSLTPRGAGRERTFGPLTGATRVDLGSGAVTKGGKAVKPAAKDKRPPVTRASVKRAGARFVLTLKARDASSRVAATFVVVNGKRRAYRKPLLLTAKQLAKTTYGSVDVFGNAEKPRKAPRR